MADTLCPAGTTKQIDLDANTEWCEDAAGKRVAAEAAVERLSILALAGLAAAAIVVASFFIGPKPRRRRRS